VSVGKQKVRSKTVNNGATNPTFSNEELLLYVSEHDWHKDCLLELWDDDVGADDLICSQKINLLHMMSVGGYKHTGDSIALFRDGKPAGHLFAECEWLPVGKLTCIVHSAKALRNPDSWGKPDPYVTVELNQLEPMELKNLDDATKRLGKKSQEVSKLSILHCVRFALLTLNVLFASNANATIGQEDIKVRCSIVCRCAKNV